MLTILDIIVERSYICGTCGNAFTRRNSLYRHVKYLCGKKPSFNCPISDCNYVGKLKQHVKQHLFRFHKVANIRDLDPLA